MRRKYKLTVRPARNAAWSGIASKIIDRVCEAAAISRDDLFSPTRRREIAETRQIAAYLMRQEGISFPQIAANLRLGDHTTIVHAVKKIESNKELRKIADRISRGQDVTNLCMARFYKKELERAAALANRPPRPRSRGELAADLVEAGTHSMAEAAREHGISLSRVGQTCNARGIKGRTTIGIDAVKGPMCEAAAERLRDIARARCAAIRAERGIPDPSAILAMHEADDLSYSEISKRLKITKNQVAGLIHRARKETAEASR